MKNHQNFDTIFQTIFFENGASRRPKWPPKSEQNHQKIMLKSNCFFNIILAWLFHDLGSIFAPKILPKMVKKHVGIDLEPQIPKIKKMTPLPSFLLVFWFQEVPKSMKNQEKSVPRCIQKSIDFFHRFWSDFWWIFLPSGTPNPSKSRPKPRVKSKQKTYQKMMPKISILASKMGKFFADFWLPKSTLGGALGPPRRPNRKLLYRSTPHVIIF